MKTGLSNSNRTNSRRASSKRQRGSAPLKMVAVLCVVLTGGWALTRSGSETESAEEGESLFHTVEAGEFIYKATEAGDVESSSNVEVVCEVKSRGSAGTIILEIVPEGTWVEELDFICKLDDSDLQTQLLNEQIDANTAESKFIQAQAVLENARLALEEYENGTFPQEVKQQESALFVSRENLRRAEEFVMYSQKLAARGYISEAQLEADRFAVEKARKELEVAEAKMKVLKTLTRAKTLNDLKAKYRSAQVALDTQETIFQLAKDQLAEIRAQIAKCIVKAPAAGQVVYANRPTSGKSSSGDILIEEGKPVREKQVIVRLPDPAKMQVFTKVNEARVDRIKVGQTAEIKMDAFSRMTLKGVVKEISDYPLPPRGYIYAHIKEYAAIVEIIDPPVSLRPGMTSEVAILVDHIDHAINLDPANNYAFASDLGLDKILIYQFSTCSGKLTKHGHADLAPGAGPRHFAISSDSQFAYSLNELHSTITSFKLDAAKGQLSPIQTISTLPTGYKDRNSTAEIRIHPNGRFLYSSNRGHDSIAVFKIHPKLGTLTPLQEQKTGGKTPRNFNITPNGEFLVAANQNSNDITILKLEPETGFLTPTKHRVETPRPVCIRFLKVQ